MVGMSVNNQDEHDGSNSKAFNNDNLLSQKLK